MEGCCFVFDVGVRGRRKVGVGGKRCGRVDRDVKVWAGGGGGGSVWLPPRGGGFFGRFGGGDGEGGNRKPMDRFVFGLGIAGGVEIARSIEKSEGLGRRHLSWPYILIGLNVLAFMLQGFMGDKLTMMGAKVNRAIAEGQFYRLLTSMFLHGSLGHLLVNSLSTYSIGPSVESWFGKKRFIALYLFSGFCGNLMSFYFLPQPSIGASGAVFGLLGALAFFLLRHRGLIRGSERNLTRFAYVIAINFAMGLSPNSQIDNFGHLGGLLGGVMFSYLLGPNLTIERIRGRPILVDRPLLSQAIRK